LQIVGTAGWRLHEYGTVGSTNDLARNLPAWSAVRADAQTGGRGRFGRVFVSDPGGLWISAVLPAEGGTQRWAGFSLMVGIHLVRLLEGFRVPGARLRWPNDPMSGKKKLGGLLIEQSTRETLIVGFGLNVRNSPWKTDPALDVIATSLERARAPSLPEPPDSLCHAENRGHGRPARESPDLLGKASAQTGGTPVPPVPTVPADIPDIFEVAVRTLDVLADAHQEMQEAGMPGAIRELNRRWAEPVPVRLALSGGKQVIGRFAGLDPQGNIRILDDAAGESLVPHQNIEKLWEIY